MAGKDLLRKHVFTFNKEDNGGESLILYTEMYANGEPDGVYYNQELTLSSYSNCATFNLLGAPLTPDLLRELANQLEKVELEAKAITRRPSDREVIEEIFKPYRG